MNVEQLFKILVKLALLENPNVEDGTAKNQAYLAGVKQMAQLYVEVGSEGRVVSAEADPLLLAVIGYEESRHKPNSRDGDCRFLRTGDICDAVGAMQLSRSAPALLERVEPQEWKGTTLKLIREPQKSVAGAYRILRYWKDQCSGSTDTLLGNWSAGKCLRGPIPMGAHRCHLAKALGSHLGGVDVGKCQKPAAPRTKSMVERLAKRIAGPAPTTTSK